MSKSFTFELMPGPDAAGYARLLFAGMDARFRKMLFWDFPDDKRGQALAKACQISWLCGVALCGREPLAMTWLVPLSTGASAVNIHFAFSRPSPHAVDLGLLFLADLRMRNISRFVCIIPRPFRHARAYARRLGFSPLCMIPQACGVAGRGVHAGELLYLDLEKTMSVQDAYKFTLAHTSWAIKDI